MLKTGYPGSLFPQSTTLLKLKPHSCPVTVLSSMPATALENHPAPRTDKLRVLLASCPRLCRGTNCQTTTVYLFVRPLLHSVCRSTFNAAQTWAQALTSVVVQASILDRLLSQAKHVAMLSITCTKVLPWTRSGANNNTLSIPTTLHWSYANANWPYLKLQTTCLMEILSPSSSTQSKSRGKLPCCYPWLTAQLSRKMRRPTPGVSKISPAALE